MDRHGTFAYLLPRSAGTVYPLTDYITNRRTTGRDSPAFDEVVSEVSIRAVLLGQAHAGDIDPDISARMKKKIAGGDFLLISELIIRK